MFTFLIGVVVGTFAAPVTGPVLLKLWAKVKSVLSKTPQQ